MSRQCGDCTKCCEGYLTGEAKGKSFYKGKPCHFVSIGKGCTIYANRPKDPCISYKCAWLTDEELPEWFKPNQINAIIDRRFIKDIPYINVIEAGETLQSNVLSWIILYAVNNNLNLCWRVDGSEHWIGNNEFLTVMKENKQ